MKSASLLRKVTLGAAGVALLLCASPAAHPKNLRKLALHDLDGGKARLSDYQGRIVVLNFWATWCGTCKEKLLRLAEMSLRYTGRQVAFIIALINDHTKRPAALH